MIAHLARCKVALAELRRMCPPVFVTPDVRVPVEPDRGEQVIEQVRSAWSEYPQTTIDGVRVTFPNGWALVRSSVTESALTFRFEADASSRLPAMVHTFCDALGEFGDQLWEAYRATTIGPDRCPVDPTATEEPR